MLQCNLIRKSRFCLNRLKSKPLPWEAVHQLLLAWNQTSHFGTHFAMIDREGFAGNKIRPVNLWNVPIVRISHCSSCTEICWIITATYPQPQRTALLDVRFAKIPSIPSTSHRNGHVKFTTDPWLFLKAVPEHHIVNKLNLRINLPSITDKCPYLHSESIWMVEIGI